MTSFRNQVQVAVVSVSVFIAITDVLHNSGSIKDTPYYELGSWGKNFNIGLVS